MALIALNVDQEWSVDQVDTEASMGAASTHTAKERGNLVFKKYSLILIPGVALAVIGFLAISSFSVDKRVALIKYEHCLSIQNQALTMLLQEFKSLPKEDDVSGFDRILGLVKLDPETNEIEWMKSSLGTCERYLP